MKRQTEAQKRQRDIAWALFQVGGAASNLQKLTAPDSQLPLAVIEDCKAISRWLREVQKKLWIENMMAQQQNANRNSTRPPSTKRKL